MPRLWPAWFDQSRSGSLAKYLEAFTHTIGVMQHPDAVERVAYEAALDLSADDVVYAEIRFCPALHTGSGMSAFRVVEAAAAGLAAGATETGLRWNLIIDALRNRDDGLEMARLATRSQAPRSGRFRSRRARGGSSPQRSPRGHSGWLGPAA